jgi:hypothetical protein
VIGTPTVAAWQSEVMTDIPAENYALAWVPDTRTALPRVGDERETLTAVLDWYRQTFELKCSGVPPERLSDKGVPPSGLSLHGLARHLAGMERWWFSMQFAGADVPRLYYTDQIPDQAFDALTGDVAEVFEIWRAECERSRRVVAEAATLDQTAKVSVRGGPISLRRILVDMIGEYARHNGHADLLRERIDGATGY